MLDRAKEILVKELDHEKGVFYELAFEKINSKGKYTKQETNIKILSILNNKENPWIFETLFEACFRPIQKVIKIQLFEDDILILVENTSRWTRFCNNIVKHIGIPTFRKLGYTAKEYKSEADIINSSKYTAVQIEKNIFLCQQNYAGDGRWSGLEMVEKLNKLYEYEKYRLTWESESSSSLFNETYKNYK